MFCGGGRAYVSPFPLCIIVTSCPGARIDLASAAASAKKALEERDNEKKAAAVAKARENQLEHEVRRLELHSEKILSRLNALLLQKDRAQKSGIEISKVLQRLPSEEEHRDNRWRVDQFSSSCSSSKADELHLLSKSLAVHESRCIALADENSCLRFTLKQLQIDLIDVLKACSKPRSPAALTLTSRDGDKSCLDDYQFDLPFHLSGASIEDALRNKMRRLKHHLIEMHSPAAQISNHQIADEASLLRDELAAALRTIGDQEVTLRSLAAAVSTSVTPSKQPANSRSTPGAARSTPGCSPGGLTFDEMQEEENRLERARRQLQRDRGGLNAAIER
jgi:hypothetical protein